MRALLLMFLICTVIFSASGQVSHSSDAVANCDAAFSVTPDSLDPLIIHFQDQSSGQITLWQWSFGDGYSTTTENPVHSYAKGGTYFVCLTVSNSDSGYICHDVKCIAITIHELGACVADYHDSIDPVNPLQINFTDKSTGNINGWHWDFGDGGFSNDPNPIHVFPAYGKFRVCLTAYNVDSVTVCNDIKCDSLEIKPPEACHADFYSKLDSLNQTPNTFFFLNTSTGDPNRFSWKFDDGTTYNTLNVKHHFQTSGLHQACLVIKRDVSGAIVCSDSVCQSIAMAKYFDLGGHLFTGEYPINNPISTGDTGVVYLYRVEGSKLTPCDTGNFTKLGYFAFPTVLNGYYLIRAALTPGSRHFLKYLPGYYPQAFQWKMAGTLNLSATNSYVSDVRLFPAVDSLSGPGVLRGKVMVASTKEKSTEIPFAEIILFDAQLKPLIFTFSDQSGLFELSHLPYGAYYLFVEFPGKYSRMTAVWLDSSTPVINDLYLEVFNHDVTDVPANVSITSMVGELFPNPANNEVSLLINLAQATSVKFEIRTLTGLTLWSDSFDCVSGNNRVTIPVKEIKPGLFLLVIRKMDGSLIVVKKLLIH